MCIVISWKIRVFILLYLFRVLKLMFVSFVTIRFDEQLPIQHGYHDIVPTAVY